MAVPNRKHQMIKNMINQRNKDSRPKGCEKQFPECPEEPNKDECRSCPFWK